jgi:hypothetical protein
MRTITRLFITGFLFIQAIPFASADGTMPVKRAGIGMNFNFHSIDMTATSRCASEGPDVTFKNTPRLTRYNDPSVQAISRNDLAQLSKRGVQWIRTMVWFAHRPVDPLNFVMGEGNEAVVENLRQVGRDLKKFGFRKWIVAFAPLAKASPTCFREQWGDCFDPAYIQSSIDFIIAARAGLESKDHPELWVDLSNEACPVDNAVSPIQWKLYENERLYLVPLIKQYSARFPTDRFTVSCVGDTQVRTRIAVMWELFSLAGSRPGFLDAHLYEDLSSPIELRARDLALAAQFYSQPFIVGETQISRPDLMTRITTSFTQLRATPESIIQWPLKDRSLKCYADHPEMIEGFSGSNGDK